MQNAVRFRDPWPGLPGWAGQAVVLPADLYALSPRIERDHRGVQEALRAFRDDMTIMVSPAEIDRTFGPWQRGRNLWTAHLSAFRSAASVGLGLSENLRSAAERLAVSYELYRRAEVALDALQGSGSLGRRLDPENFRRRAEKGTSSVWEVDPYTPPGTLAGRPGLWYPARVAGELPVSIVSNPGGPEYYSAAEIGLWLRLLYKARAWSHHYIAAQVWKAANGYLDNLSRIIYGRALEMDYSWRSIASGFAQKSLRELEGSTRSLADFTGTMAIAVNASADVLRETLGTANVRWAGRSSAARKTFETLNSRYMEVFDPYPRALPFVLPFGGLVPPVRPGPGHAAGQAAADDRAEPSAVPVREHQPPVALESGIIGDAPMPTGNTSWDEDATFWDLGHGGTGPGVIR